MHGTYSRKLCRFLLTFSIAFTSLCLTSFSSIGHLLRLCAQFFILFQISRSTHLLLFLETLTSSQGLNSYNCSISNDLTQMVNIPTWIPDCDSPSPALLDLFLCYDASIYSTMAFPPLGNSDHVVVSVSIDFPSYSQLDAPFHCRAYDYSRAD